MPIEISEAPSVVGSVAQDWKVLASRINSRLLQADTNYANVEQHCRDAAEHEFASVVVSPTHVALAASALSGTHVKVGTLVGFPFGASTTTTKRHEALDVIRLGAQCFDLILNLSALKSGDRIRVETELRSVAELARDNGASIHASIEASLLSLEEKILACQLAVAAGCDGVSSGTGFNSTPSAPSDIALMRGVLGDKLDVIACDGVATYAEVQTMFEAGASRITSSSALTIIRSAQSR